MYGVLHTCLIGMYEAFGMLGVWSAHVGLVTFWRPWTPFFPSFFLAKGGRRLAFVGEWVNFFFPLGNTKWYYCPVLPPAAYHGDWGWGDGPADGAGKGTWRQTRLDTFGRRACSWACCFWAGLGLCRVKSG